MSYPKSLNEWVLHLHMQIKYLDNYARTNSVDQDHFDLGYSVQKFETILRKCHYRETQPSRGTKGREDEKQIRTSQTPHMKPRTHRQRGTATGELSKPCYYSAPNFRRQLSSALFFLTNYRLERSLYVKLKDWMSNRVNLDETAHDEPSHLDLRCLQSSFINAYGCERVWAIVKQMILTFKARSKVVSDDICFIAFFRDNCK